ncbi:MAG TPA: serine hydrolase [Gemmatimonadales bacterium]|nr:serine hydrolase [Gemmatimonadales bacterium]
MSSRFSLHHLRPAFLVACFLAGPLQAQDSIPAADRYQAAAARLSEFIGHEMADKDLPGLSIALVDDQQTVWARGFGVMDARDSTLGPVTARSIYRVASVSKLFTALAVMRLVEQKKIDLDQPISRYLPDFHPTNPFDRPITARMLLTHRSGLVREPPIGGLGDSTSPSLADAIASLNTTRLVYRPDTHTKYSNAAFGVLGLLVQKLSGDSFAVVERRDVLGPLGMSGSDFTPRADLIAQLAHGRIWAPYGREEPAPVFDFGIAPAANLYTSVLDLGKFESSLFGGGRGVVAPDVLNSMLQPQAAPPSPFGLAFELGMLDGHRTAGHGGVTFGYATTVLTVPDQKLGVVVVATQYFTNAVTDRIAREALRAMLAAKAGTTLPPPEQPDTVPTELSRRLAGHYGSGDRAVDLEFEFDRLFATWFSGGPRAEVRLLGDTLITDDRISYGRRLLPLGTRLVSGRDTLMKVVERKPQAAPARWTGLIGEYGPSYGPLVILEKDGRLVAQRAMLIFYPLTEMGRDTFQFPPQGLYDGERIVFSRDSNGRAVTANQGGVLLPRRQIEPDAGAVFRIAPVRPVEELRPEALAATPPVDTVQRLAPDLVELTTLDSTIHLDIRYATTRNFMGAAFYSQARAFMQRPAAEALVRAAAVLRRQGFGLLIHDAYRPWYVTKMFWDATPPAQHVFVASPKNGSRHNRGAAVDLTLYSLADGKPVTMPSTYDEFSPRAYADYPGGTSLERWHREVLRRAMEAEGFVVYTAEWWHFDYKDWRQYPVLNLTFEQLKP